MRAPSRRPDRLFPLVYMVIVWSSFISPAYFLVLRQFLFSALPVARSMLSRWAASRQLIILTAPEHLLAPQLAHFQDIDAPMLTCLAEDRKIVEFHKTEAFVAVPKTDAREMLPTPGHIT